MANYRDQEYVCVKPTDYSFAKILLTLEKNAYKFLIVDNRIGTPRFNDGVDHSAVGEKLINDLQIYNYKVERVTEWEGMGIDPRYFDYVFRYWYKCHYYSLNILKEIGDFLYIDQDMAFYKDHCLLYTVAHENDIFMEKIFWKKYQTL